MTVKEILFALFRCVICGETLSEERKNAIKPEHLPTLYKMSCAHDLSHLVCEALEKNGLLPQTDDGIEDKFRQQRQLAVCRYEQIDYEYQRLLSAFEAAKIAHIPLKGAILRAYYPEPWLRTSCDIDILVSPQDMQAAVGVLTDGLGYQPSGRTAHDESFYSVGGVHVELHHELIEQEQNDRGVLARVWPETVPMTGKTYCRVMNDETFYFYHIAHMAKHFECGGCGIRPFLDLWLLDARAPEGTEKRDALLKEGGLFTFAEAVRKLSRVWLTGEAHDETTERLEAFILCGGVYGNLENRVAVQQRKKGGKLRYALSRVFLSYDELRVQYPVLERKKWLTPVCEVRRWFRLAFGGRAKRSMREFSVNASTSSEKQKEIDGLLKDLGL